MAPMSATPSEDPSCWPVYCRPPASPRPEASTDDCTTLPSWDTMSPIPTPSTAMPRAKERSSSVGCTLTSRTKTPATVTQRPVRTIVRTAKRLDRREPNAEATNIVIETGIILMPVSRASRPSTSCR